MQNNNNPNPDPLHGVTLETILIRLEKVLGWEKMYAKIPIRCFQFNPSIKSSLAFLRKTPWARQKVETMYVFNINKIKKYLQEENNIQK